MQKLVQPHRALIILQVPGPLDYRKIDAAAGNYRSLRFFCLTLATRSKINFKPDVSTTVAAPARLASKHQFRPRQG